MATIRVRSPVGGAVSGGSRVIPRRGSAGGKERRCRHQEFFGRRDEIATDGWRRSMNTLTMRQVTMARLRGCAPATTTFRVPDLIVACGPDSGFIAGATGGGSCHPATRPTPGPTLRST